MQTGWGVGPTGMGVGQTGMGVGQTGMGVGQTGMGVGQTGMGVGQTGMGLGMGAGNNAPPLGTTKFGGSPLLAGICVCPMITKNHTHVPQAHVQFGTRPVMGGSTIGSIATTR